jgi:tRNA-splicing ligase RtcB
MTAPIATWLAEPLPALVKAALAKVADSDDVVRLAVMPDVHLSGQVCIGTVVATRRLLYPEAVGGDIGCGMAAVRFECEAARLDEAQAAATLLDGLYRRIPAIRHPVAEAPALPDRLASRLLSDGALEKWKARDGRLELGTLGRGNHFLEFQSDDEGWLWLMIHSGSRAMGQAIRDHHLRLASDGATGLKHLDAESAAGRAYLDDMAWALEFADENRRVMARAVGELMAERFGVEMDESSFIACHHNHVRRETHDGEELWVHRKGAISAAVGEMGIIPGSMGSESHHVEGRGVAGSLCSSSHGAGRRLARGEAKRAISTRELSRQLDGVWFDRRFAERMRDEAPSAYKDIHAVMRAQGELTRIVRTLRPVVSYKGC